MGLGTLARDNGQPAEALKFFISASVAAAVFEEIETVEDALIAASDVHLGGVPQQSLPQLPPALAWATRKRLPHLVATISVLGAENQTALRKTSQAGKLLSNARKSTGRRGQLAAGLAARAEFVSSQIQYQQGRLTGARTAFRSAIQQQRTISPWICLLYTSPSPRDATLSRMPSSA